MTPPAACSSLIPERWSEGIEGAPLPDFAAIDAADDPVEAEARAWQQFGVAQTGRLTMANGRTADVIGIFTRCEERANEARD